jgi:hypothetical protein
MTRRLTDPKPSLFVALYIGGWALLAGGVLVGLIKAIWDGCHR